MVLSGVCIIKFFFFITFIAAVCECEYLMIIVHIFLSRIHELEYSETQEIL